MIPSTPFRSFVPHSRVLRRLTMAPLLVTLLPVAIVVRWVVALPEILGDWLYELREVWR